MVDLLAALPKVGAMEASVASRSHVVWIDDKQARILTFDVKAVGQSNKVEKIDAADHEFFEKVAETIADAGTTLIAGPGKDEFASFLTERRPPIRASVAATEQPDAPSEEQLLEIVRRSMSKPLNPFGSYSEAFKIYEDGKHRRYSLLFAVNGGVLAILKFGKGVQTLSGVAPAMVIFTIYGIRYLVVRRSNAKSGRRCRSRPVLFRVVGR